MLKIFFGVLISVIAITTPFAFAEDHGEDHICFKQIDSDHDGNVTFTEFKKFYGNNPEMYHKMDADNDGKLTHDEYEEYLYNNEE